MQIKNNMQIRIMKTVILDAATCQASMHIVNNMHIKDMQIENIQYIYIYTHIHMHIHIHIHIHIYYRC